MNKPLFIQLVAASIQPVIDNYPKDFQYSDSDPEMKESFRSGAEKVLDIAEAVWDQMFIRGYVPHDIEDLKDQAKKEADSEEKQKGQEG